jgi:hypothetical protein
MSRVGGLEILAPLSVEEERHLYPVITRGREATHLLEGGVGDSAQRRRLAQQRQSGQEAESRLLRATLGLVRTRVHERGYRFGNEELEAAGVEGLANALRRFDPARGVRFATYANYWIVKLVNQAIQTQAGISDSEMRLVLALDKLRRSHPTTTYTERDVARELSVPLSKARDVLATSRDIASRRFEPAAFSDDTDLHEPPATSDAPPWVIDALKRLCGEDFDAFWQHSFRTTSLEELAGVRGITRQGMAKRLEKCRRAVRASADAARLQEWFDRQ